MASATTTVAGTGGASTVGTGGNSGTGGSVSACAAPSTIQDCKACTTQSACTDCASMVDQAGVEAYNTLLNCVFCNSCYTTCDGVAANSGCAMALDGGAPTEDTNCDTGTPGMSTCGTCQMCSVKSGGQCSAALTACEGIMQCVDLLLNLATVCGSAQGV